jgi:hypothetical protein
MPKFLEVPVTGEVVVRAFGEPIFEHGKGMGSDPVVVGNELAFSDGPSNGEHETTATPEAVRALLELAATERATRSR